MTRPSKLPSVDFLRERYHYCPTRGVFSRRRKDGSLKPLTPNYDRKGYVRVSVCGHIFAAHRLAWYYINGDWPDLQIDHINGVKDDNRAVNLRLATNSQNNAYRPLTKNNSSGVKGVSWHARKRKWQVYIRAAGRNKNLGYYEDIEHARVAYRVAAKLIYGEFAHDGSQT